MSKIYNGSNILTVMEAPFLSTFTPFTPNLTHIPNTG